MPNHITTHITGPNHVLSALLRPLTDEEKMSALEDCQHRLSYRISRLKETKVETGEYTQTWYLNLDDPVELADQKRLVVDFNLIVPQPENMETGGCTGTHAPGVVCWHQWNSNNWGTKWNAYDTIVELDEETGFGIIKMETAWSHPFPVMEALMNKFPEDTFYVEWADEDTGYNVGEYKVQEGEQVDYFDHSDTDEGRELASVLNYGRHYADVKAEWDAEDEEYLAELEVEVDAE